MRRRREWSLVSGRVRRNKNSTQLVDEIRRCRCPMHNRVSATTPIHSSPKHRKFGVHVGVLYYRPNSVRSVMVGRRSVTTPTIHGQLCLTVTALKTHWSLYSSVSSTRCVDRRNFTGSQWSHNSVTIAADLSAWQSLTVKSVYATSNDWTVGIYY